MSVDNLFRRDPVTHDLRDSHLFDVITDNIFDILNSFVNRETKIIQEGDKIIFKIISEYVGVVKEKDDKLWVDIISSY